MALILTLGVYLSVKMRFFQLFRLRRIFKLTVFAKDANKSALNSQDKTSLTPAGAFFSSLAATVGVGSLSGVAAAIAVGGAGAVLWMWVSGFLGMIICYAENLLGGIYRQNKDNSPCGGAVYYIRDGLDSKGLALFYAVCCVLACFGMGTASQAWAAADALRSLGTPKPLAALILVAAALTFVFCRKKTISRFCQRFVPLAAGVYIILCLVILIINIKALPGVFLQIFKEAFNLNSAVGGGIGSVISTGFCRGVFSNEAGLGSTVSLHASSTVKAPHRLGFWGISEVFCDTIIICTLSALVLLVCKTDSLAASFSRSFGSFGSLTLTLSLLMLSFATLIGWRMIGLDAWEFIFLKHNKNRLLFCLLWLAAVCLGSLFSASSVWELADFANGLMLIPNLTAIFLLRRKVLTQHKKYAQSELFSHSID